MKSGIYFLLAILSGFGLASCDRSLSQVDIIPEPSSMEILPGTFKAAGSPVSFDSPSLDPTSRKHIIDFASRLSQTSGKASKLSTSALSKGFIFVKDPSLGEEEYELVVKGKKARVSASTSTGFFYAIQTLSQMLPVEYFGSTPSPGADWKIQNVSIKDAPRFGYRGMHLDVSRHFFDVNEVKKYIDVIALHKMNRLHWHLTDDQGWRIEIKKYPRLTEVGSMRDETIVLKNFKPFKGDGKPYGGYYTQDQIKDVVNYAAEKGITIIPEIDLPGHMLAAIAAYPELSCTGKKYKVWSMWGVADEVLCPGKDKTFEFLEDVLTEVMDLFPSEYIHIGGDECPKTYWKTCAACQRRIRLLGLKDDDQHTKEQYLQNYVTERIQNFVNEHGRKIIGWDEILEGKLAEGATVMSWRGVAGGIEAATHGFDAIMTPNSYLYFDYYQSQDMENEPFGIGGNLPIEKVYSYEPFEGIPAQNQGHILGVQANLWTEYIGSNEHLEYMLLPRLDALSEIQWTPEGRKDFETFKTRLSHMRKIYDALGYTYCKDVFGEKGFSFDAPKGSAK